MDKAKEFSTLRESLEAKAEADIIESMRQRGFHRDHEITRKYLAAWEAARSSAPQSE